MIDKTSDTDDLIAALATPWGQSALAVIRTSGSSCIETVDAIFKSAEKLKNAEGRTLLYGSLTDIKNNTVVDEVIAGIYRSPRSYTGEDMVEIFCHGSIPCINSVLEVLRGAGFRDANPGEFTLRAFLNSKMDLTRAEAVNDIISAKTEKAKNLALNRLSGSIEEQINIAKNITAELLSVVELQLDYPEDEADPDAVPGFEKIDKAIDVLENLSSTYAEGRIIQEGVKAVLTGKTNAGKSALFNLLSREERSIVSDSHGTTRDYIESYISIKGVPVKIFDTAGLRTSMLPGSNPVEEEGIKRSTIIVDNSDIIIYLVDSTSGICSEDKERLSRLDNKKTVKVWNKTDISNNPAPEGFVPVSAVTGKGLVLLEEEILKKAGSGTFSSTESAVIDSERQKKLLDFALASLKKVKEAASGKYLLDIIAVDLRDALDSLGEITGEVTTSDILDMIFSRFCVGK